MLFHLHVLVTQVEHLCLLSLVGKAVPINTLFLDHPPIKITKPISSFWILKDLRVNLPPGLANLPAYYSFSGGIRRFISLNFINVLLDSNFWSKFMGRPQLFLIFINWSLRTECLTSNAKLLRLVIAYNLPWREERGIGWQTTGQACQSFEF